MQLKLHTLIDLCRQWVAINASGTLVGEFRQIVGLELDAIDLIVAAEFLDFLLTFFLRELVLAILIGGELIIKLLLCKLLAPLLFGSKILRYGEERHDGVIVETIDLHLIQYLKGIRQRLWHITEDVVHLLTRLKPFLLGVEHTCRIVQIFGSSQTEQMVVGLGILLVHKMGIVGTHQFDAIFLGQFDKHLIGFLLQREGLAIGSYHGVGHLVTLQLQIVVIAPETLVPLDSLTGTCNITFQNLGRHLTSDTGRADNQILVIFLKLHTVCTRTVVETVNPGIADKLDEVLIAVSILGQHDKVIAAKVILGLAKALVTSTGHIHLAAENRFKRFQTCLLTVFVQAHANVVKFFNTEHVSMIGDSHTTHAVLNSFVYKPLNTRLSIEN